MEINPFCQYFKYRERAKVYCTYDRMVLRLEDWSNIVKALHTDIYFIFIYDDLCGLDRGRLDKLNVTNTSSVYVRTQRNMNPKIINKEVGCLGLHERIIGVGDDQRIVFQ